MGVEQIEKKNVPMTTVLHHWEMDYFFCSHIDVRFFFLYTMYHSLPKIRGDNWRPTPWHFNDVTWRPCTRLPMQPIYRPRNVTEYDQEKSQSQTADQSTAPRATGHSKSSQLSLPRQDDSITRKDIKQCIPKQRPTQNPQKQLGYIKQ